jgi:two-component system, chemotaxis family, sensor kinase Cph1
VSDPGPTIDFLPPGTPVDLTNCEREPIHVPGSIQPRGVLIAVSDPDHVVQQVSENLAELTGVDWQGAPGRPLAHVLGTAPAQAVIRSASAFGDLRERNPVEITSTWEASRSRWMRCCTVR